MGTDHIDKAIAAIDRVLDDVLDVGNQTTTPEHHGLSVPLDGLAGAVSSAGVVSTTEFPVDVVLFYGGPLDNQLLRVQSTSRVLRFPVMVALESAVDANDVVQMIQVDTDIYDRCGNRSAVYRGREHG